MTRPSEVVADTYSRDTDEDSFLYIKGIAPEDHQSGNRFELADFARWAHAVQTTDKDLDRLFALADACDSDLTVIRATLERSHEEPEPVSFLVPGLIPRGVVTLLLGDKKTGKSAVAMELAVAIARKESHWLGFPLAPCKGFAVYLLGEDAPGEAARRVERMTGGNPPHLSVQRVGRRTGGKRQPPLLRNHLAKRHAGIVQNLKDGREHRRGNAAVDKEHSVVADRTGFEHALGLRGFAGFEFYDHDVLPFRFWAVSIEVPEPKRSGIGDPHAPLGFSPLDIRNVPPGLVRVMLCTRQVLGL